MVVASRQLKLKCHILDSTGNVHDHKILQARTVFFFPFEFSFCKRLRLLSLGASWHPEWRLWWLWRRITNGFTNGSEWCHGHVLSDHPSMIKGQVTRSGDTEKVVAFIQWTFGVSYSLLHPMTLSNWVSQFQNHCNNFDEHALLGRQCGRLRVHWHFVAVEISSPMRFLQRSHFNHHWHGSTFPQAYHDILLTYRSKCLLTMFPLLVNLTWSKLPKTCFCRSKLPKKNNF